MATKRKIKKPAVADSMDMVVGMGTGMMGNGDAQMLANALKMMHTRKAKGKAKTMSGKGGGKGKKMMGRG